MVSWSSALRRSHQATRRHAQLLPLSTKKLVEAHLLSDDDTADGFEKGCALIRANLGVDPTQGTYDDWAANYAQALWLEKWRMRNKAEMMAALFGGKGK